MKFLIAGFLLLASPLTAQQGAEEEVKQAIVDFFDSFHQKDTAALRAATAKGVVLQTIGRGQQGEPLVKTESFDQFMASIGSIPDSLSFHENIKSYHIKVDGPMANAWTPYDFSFNGKFSHCGVNSFQLVRQGGAWKIIYLIDTRRKEDCP